MKPFYLTRLAKDDLAEIFNYTWDQRSLNQAQVYLLGLESAFKELATSPHLGTNTDYWVVGSIMYRYKSHFIFYRFVDDEIEIFRVIHKSRDILNRLEKL